MTLTPSKLANARARLNNLMSETIRAGRATDGTDPVTGDATQVITDARYEGSARVKYNSSAVADSGATGALVMSQNIIVKIPVQPVTLTPGEDEESGPGVVPAVNVVLHEGDLIEVTESVADPSLVGRKYIVTGAPDAGQVSAHRYPVTELS